MNLDNYYFENSPRPTENIINVPVQNNDKIFKIVTTKKNNNFKIILYVSIGIIILVKLIK